MARETIIALFDDFREAQEAVAELEAAGIPAGDIGIIASNLGDRYGTYRELDGSTRTAEGAGIGGAVGAAAGGGAALLVGLGALTIPGIGPVIAAGALISTLAGLGAGAAAGGVVGALVGSGISRPHADLYAEALRRGGTLLSVPVDAAGRGRVSEIIERHAPVDIETRAADWRKAAPAESVGEATTMSGARADHGVSAGQPPEPIAMPTGSGAFTPREEDKA